MNLSPEIEISTTQNTLCPQISVIIPTCHRNDLLAKCLDCLNPGVQTLPFDQYEVIVTDDGSRSTAEQMVCEQYSWAKWIAGPRKGPAANRNNGTTFAQGEWLAFTDDDCLPSPDWLQAFANVITAEFDVYEGKTTCEAGIRSPLEHAPVNEDGDRLWSCNMVVERTTFESLGRFDEGFPYPACEDIEFQERIKRSRKHCLFVEQAIVDHPPRRVASGRKLGAQLESQVRLWYMTGHRTYLRTQFPTHIKCRIRNILDYPLCRDSFLAVFSLIVELVYVLGRVRAWDKKYRTLSHTEPHLHEINCTQ